MDKEADHARNESNLFDVRLVEHHIRRGTTSQADYQAHLDSLEDCAEMAVETEVKFANPYEQRHFASTQPSEDA